MCELVLNPRAAKSSWRTLSELYTLRKLVYHRTVPSGPYSRPICTERHFQARWKELVASVQLDNPVATVLPKATGISLPFASWVMGRRLWLDMSVAIVHGATWGVPRVLRGTSNFKNHHSHTCKTTSTSISRDVAPGTPPPPGPCDCCRPVLKWHLGFLPHLHTPPPTPPPNVPH